MSTINIAYYDVLPSSNLCVCGCEALEILEASGIKLMERVET
jgi:hypothetical protein